MSQNVAQAERLYRTACGLVAANYKPPSHEAIACPADYGLVYDIVFSGQSGNLATARYHASGCRTLWMVIPSGAHLSTWVLGTRAPMLDEPFEAALVAVLGVPLFP